MIRRPPRSTLSSSSAASDVYKRQLIHLLVYTYTSYFQIYFPLSIGDRIVETYIQNIDFSSYSLLLTDEESVGDKRLHSVYVSITVSYTHLRAHETPEHLVCRLLLEKKKKKNNKTKYIK
eukprot:TRINITY_DN19186_c0_g1_i1.p1 TRINITY_DN19186_c0_g1~~TRINITY_DN19186_c0_g1_i1.p1  ORF type:complete len:120 (-),score=22.97 TRINITY_DN19186_c0_g1_i1:26-385(-)